VRINEKKGKEREKKKERGLRIFRETDSECREGDGNDKLS